MNPAHLFLGTKFDNMRDCADKGRLFLAKITRVQAEEIRLLHKAGKGSYRTLAKQFGVTWPQIGHIIKRRTWK